MKLPNIAPLLLAASLAGAPVTETKASRLVDQTHERVLQSLSGEEQLMAYLHTQEQHEQKEAIQKDLGKIAV